jgi:hypothetical protein
MSKDNRLGSDPLAWMKSFKDEVRELSHEVDEANRELDRKQEMIDGEENVLKIFERPGGFDWNPLESLHATSRPFAIADVDGELRFVNDAFATLAGGMVGADASLPDMLLTVEGNKPKMQVLREGGPFLFVHGEMAVPVMVETSIVANASDSDRFYHSIFLEPIGLPDEETQEMQRITVGVEEIASGPMAHLAVAEWLSQTSLAAEACTSADDEDEEPEYDTVAGFAARFAAAVDAEGLLDEPGVERALPHLAGVVAARLVDTERDIAPAPIRFEVEELAISPGDALVVLFVMFGLASASRKGDEQEPAVIARLEQATGSHLRLVISDESERFPKKIKPGKMEGLNGFVIERVLAYGGWVASVKDTDKRVVILLPTTD